MKTFDPNAPLVDQATGLEYEDLAALLRGSPVDCARNDAIQALRRHPYVRDNPGSWAEKVAWQYRYQSRSGDHRAHRVNALRPWRYPQLPEAFGRFLTDDPEFPGSIADA